MYDYVFMSILILHSTYAMFVLIHSFESRICRFKTSEENTRDLTLGFSFFEFVFEAAGLNDVCRSLGVLLGFSSASLGVLMVQYFDLPGLSR